MKVGDVVKVIAMKRVTGIIIKIDEFCGFPHVLIVECRVLGCPYAQLEAISESR